MVLEKMERPMPALEMSVEDNFRSVYPGCEIEFNLNISNTGDGEGSYQFFITVEYDDFKDMNMSALLLWNVSVSYRESVEVERTMMVDLSNFFSNKEVSSFELGLSPGAETWVNVTVNASNELDHNSEIRLGIAAVDRKTEELSAWIIVQAKVSSVELFSPSMEELLYVEGNSTLLANFRLTLTNIAPFPDNFSVDAISRLNGNGSAHVWDTWTNATPVIQLQPNESYTFGLRIQVPWNLTQDISAVFEVELCSESLPSLDISIQFKVDVKFPVDV